jgi:uncharacterized delta-60 repeat protein
MTQAVSLGLRVLIVFVVTHLCAEICNAAGAGSLDPNFRTLELKGNTNFFFFGVECLALQADGKILVGGSFESVQGEPRNGLARLNSNGSIDLTFNPPTTADTWVTSMAVQPDGRILINAGLPDAEGNRQSYITRFNANGSVDTSFAAPAVHPERLIVAPDGKLYLSGTFTEIKTDPVTRQFHLARLNSDGSFDFGYRPPVGAYGLVAEEGMVRMALQPDGKMVLAGMFGTAQGKAFARFNENGTLDQSFSGSDQGVNFCNALMVQPDGKILHGFGRSMNGSMGYDTYVSVRRFNSDGTIDRSYRENTDIPGYVESIAIQPDGKILAGGYFFTPGRYWKQDLVRFQSDGTRDESLVFGEGTLTNTFGGDVKFVLVQPDGRILVGGRFDYPAADGIRRAHLVRLRGDAAFLTSMARTQTGEWSMSWKLADPERSYSLEMSTNLFDWSEVSKVSKGSSNLDFKSGISESAMTFYRVSVE